jgi:hypothetical protein
MKSTQIEVKEKKLNCFVKFYANAPDGTKNKYLVYKVYATERKTPVFRQGI